MRRLLRAAAHRAILPLVLLTAMSSVASAQSQADGWNVGLYPVFIWVPTGIDIDVKLPADGGGDLGSIVDSRFDGAYLGGFYASKNWFRADVDIVWAAIGGDRVDTPAFSVDADLVYFHGTGGVQVAPGFYATAGVRRLALKYDITVAGFPEFEREPGFWDPVIGVGYHLEGEGRPIEFHATFEAGGFGVGADQDYGAMGRVDWKPFPHFGVTAGYAFLYFKATDTQLDREFEVKQSVHGPVFGVGFYF
jgi:hypothetical protein